MRVVDEGEDDGQCWNGEKCLCKLSVQKKPVMGMLTLICERGG